MKQSLKKNRSYASIPPTLSQIAPNYMKAAEYKIITLLDSIQINQRIY